MQSMAGHTHGLGRLLPNVRLGMDSQWLLSVQWVGLRSFTTPPGHSLESDPALGAAVGCFASQLWICGSSGSLWLQGFPIQGMLMFLRILNNWSLQTQLSHEK